MTDGATIIDGKKISEEILSDLKDKIDKSDISPKLVIILVGDDVASNIYVENKIKAANRVGIVTELKKFENNISETILIEEIKTLNKDSSVSGIIVQMPLPDHISKYEIMLSLDPKKDVDGFHPINVGLLYSSYQSQKYNGGFVPCTASGCLTLIKHCIKNLSGKNVVVIGRSNIVGRPLAALLLKENCTVTICHSKTQHLSDITLKADIVVSAVGRAEFLTSNFFNDRAIVIDVGISRIKLENKYKLVGDIDFNSVKNKVAYITPVPGGVGPMTVAYLLVNTYIAQTHHEMDKIHK